MSENERPAVLTEEFRIEQAQAGRDIMDSVHRLLSSGVEFVSTQRTVHALCAAAQAHFMAAGLPSTPQPTRDVRDFLRRPRPAPARNEDVA